METSTKSAYKILILDLFDAYHYADFVEGDWRYSWLTGGPSPINSLEKATALADRLFFALNPDATTRQEWTKWEAGYDVRVYDMQNSCVYKAYEKLPENNFVSSVRTPWGVTRSLDRIPSLGKVGKPKKFHAFLCMPPPLRREAEKGMKRNFWVASPRLLEL